MATSRRRRLAALHGYADRMPRPGSLLARFLRRARSARSRRRPLSPLAVRSYETRGRLRPEPECDVRTPFQRDRDRIVHSKPFRRLKGKTQVFIDPAGDHYRTRMTHTLETTGIARVVARALRLNEDLVEAIGLGHDTGHTPFGHAGEEALDAVLARTVRRALPPQRAVAADRRAAQPHPRGPRRDPHPHRRARAGDARGKDRPHRRPRRLHQPRHRRRDPLRDPRGGRPARERRSRCSARAARKRIDTLVHDLVETSARARATSSRATRSAAAMLSLRAFMFERVYLGPETHEPSTSGRARPCEAIFDALVGAGRAARADHRVHRRDDRPLRARHTLQAL